MLPCRSAWKRLVVTSTCVGRSTWNLELGASPNGGVWRASCRLALIDSCHAVWSMMRLRSQSECMRTSRKQQNFECGVWDVSWTGKHGRDKVGTRANLQLRTFVRGVSQFAYMYIVYIVNDKMT